MILIISALLTLFFLNNSQNFKNHGIIILSSFVCTKKISANCEPLPEDFDYKQAVREARWRKYESLN